MTKDMTSGNPARIIFTFTLPIIAGNIFQQIYSLVDTIIVGRTIGVDALAAVGATSIVAYFALCFIQGITSGFAILLGQKFGAGDEEGVRRSVATSILLCVIFSILITALTVYFAVPILRWMRTPLDIFEGAYEYIIIIFWGSTATVFYNMFSNISRSIGDSRTPLIFLGLSAILNIVLDLVFILTFNMGVGGAALATVLSQVVATLLCLVTMLKKFPILRLEKKDWCISKESIKMHLAVGLPMGFQMSVMCIGLLAMQVAVNKLGSICVAGFTAASKVDQLAIQFNLAFGISIASYVAQNYGAGEKKRIKEGVTACLIQSVICSIIVGAFILIFGKPMVQLFLEEANAEIMDYAMTFLKVMVPLYSILSVLVVYRSALQGMGNTKIPFFACIGELFARIFATFIFAGLWGYVGICFASPLAWFVASIIVFIAYWLWAKR